MVITDIEQIDAIAAEMFGTGKGFVSVDMGDYSSVKVYSSLLKAVKVVVPQITAGTLTTLGNELKSVCTRKVCNLLMYIQSKEIKCGEKAITVNQLQLLQEIIDRNVSDDTEVIWGMGEGMSVDDDITILFVVGF